MVLLSASVRRFSVSRMWDFFLSIVCHNNVGDDTARDDIDETSGDHTDKTVGDDTDDIARAVKGKVLPQDTKEVKLSVLVEQMKL